MPSKDPAAAGRAYRAAHPGGEVAKGRWYRHGLDPAGWRALWDAQDGRCYLCGREMTEGNGSKQTQACAEHVHDHCGPDRSCRACRRGLACWRCNVIIGHAEDDPELLMTIASALLTATIAARERIADAPATDPLF